MDDIVEVEKVARTPTNHRASDLVSHGLDLDVVHRELRGNKEEKAVAEFLGLEVRAGPRNEFGLRERLGLAEVHESTFWVGNAHPRYHSLEK